MLSSPDNRSVVADVAHSSSFAKLLPMSMPSCTSREHHDIGASWSEVLEDNVVGGYNCFGDVRRKEITTVMFAYTDHVVEIYDEECKLMI